MEEVEETIGWSIGTSAKTHPMDQCVQCSHSFVAVQYQSCHPGFARIVAARAGCTMRERRFRRPTPCAPTKNAQDLTMECTVNWVPASGMGFVAETGSGHLLTMDGAADGGGRNLAPRPMETVLAGAAGCTAYDVVLILQRGRHPVTGCQVKVTSERAPADPKVFTRMHLHFIVTGNGIPDAAVARAIQMSHDKYCSATIMLGKTAEITTSFEMVAG
jgi:putative redox protein